MGFAFPFQELALFLEPFSPVATLLFIQLIVGS